MLLIPCPHAGRATRRSFTTFRMLLRPSFAAYLETWLRDAEVGLG